MVFEPKNGQSCLETELANLWHHSFETLPFVLHTDVNLAELSPDLADAPEHRLDLAIAAQAAPNQWILAVQLDDLNPGPAPAIAPLLLSTCTRLSLPLLQLRAPAISREMVLPLVLWLLDFFYGEPLPSPEPEEDPFSFADRLMVTREFYGMAYLRQQLQIGGATDFRELSRGQRQQADHRYWYRTSTLLEQAPLAGSRGESIGSAKLEIVQTQTPAPLAETFQAKVGLEQHLPLSNLPITVEWALTRQFALFLCLQAALLRLSSLSFS